MRLSIILLVTAAFTLLPDSSARMIETNSHLRLRQNMATPDIEDLSDQSGFLRALQSKNPEENDDSEDSEEERGLSSFTTLEKLKALRKAERIKEIKEALALAKVEVKAAADAAAKVTKAKVVAQVSAQLDDAEKMLTNREVKNEVFNAWHNEGIHPQAVFDAIAQSGKYTTAKWEGIAVAYLDYATEMAKAAARHG